MSAIAFLAGLGAGALDGREKKKAEERQAKLDAQADERYAFDKSERERTVADRKMLRDAAAPIAVTEDQLQGPAAEGETMPTVYKAGAQTFASRGLADASAEEQRQTNVMSAANTVDPLGATARRSAATQSKAAELQMKEAAAKAIKEGTLTALGIAAQGGDSDTFKSAFNAHGEKRLKDVKVEPFVIDHPALGKIPSAKIVGTFEDGTPFEVKDAHAAGMGLMEAAKRFDLNLSVAREGRAASHEKVMEGIAQQQANTQEQYRKDQGAHLRRLENAARESAKTAGVSGPVWNNDADKYLRDKYESKDPETGKIVVDGDGMQFGKIIALAAAQRFGGDTTRALGFAFDQDQAIRVAAEKAAAASGGKQSVDDLVRQGRQQALQRLMAPPEPPKPPPGPVAAPGATPLPGQAVIDPAIRAAPRGSWTRPGAAAAAAQGVQPAGQGPQAAQGQADTPQGPALDAAKAATDAAYQRFMSFGLRQRAENPRGFEQAKVELEAARQAEQQAIAAYQASLGNQAQFANRYSKP